MGITAVSGPHISYGLTRTASDAVTEYNEERGPDATSMGHMLLDPRGTYCYKPGSPVGTDVQGWWNNVGIVDAIPGLLSSVSLGSTTVLSTNTAITLSTQSSGSVTANVILHPSSNPNASVTVLAIDSTYSVVPRGLSFGEQGTMVAWDPALAVSRCIWLGKQSSQDDTGGTITIQGYDVYGYKMTETITGTSSQGSSNIYSQRAFKYVQSVTPSGVFTSTGMTVGVSDIYGFPLAVRNPVYTDVAMAVSSALVILTGQSCFITLAALTSITPTATTADPRGTWASTTASSGVGQRIFMRVTPRVQDMQAMSATYSSTGFAAVYGQNYSS